MNSINKFEVMQNYPNPFHPSTKISWQSPTDGCETLKFYDLLRRQVTSYVEAEKPAGYYDVEFDALELPSGL